MWPKDFIHIILLACVTLNLIIILMISIISFVTIFGLYVKFKKEGLIPSKNYDKKTRRYERGFFVLMIGLMFTVSAYGYSFILTTGTDFCIVNEIRNLVITIKIDGINNSTNTTLIEGCISKNSDFNMVTHFVGFAGIILLVYATYLLSPLTFKKSRN